MNIYAYISGPLFDLNLPFFLASGIIVGTPMYMSPEICRGDKCNFLAPLFGRRGEGGVTRRIGGGGGHSPSSYLFPADTPLMFVFDVFQTDTRQMYGV